MRVPRLTRRHAPLSLMLLFIVVGCPQQGERLKREELQPITHSRLERFESEDAFKAHLDKVKELRERTSSGDGGPSFGCGSPPVQDDGVASPSPADPYEEESITNNQEEGVDEGGIVKAVDDYFVILRRGRLFTVRQGEGAEALVPVHQVDSYAPGFTRGSWYDEMLVHGRRVIVIGYSYEVGATEVVLFQLGDDGRLTHESSHFLRSFDYYSVRNYTGRRVGNTLVFYIPHYLGDEKELPSISSWNGQNGTSGWSSMLSQVEIYRPVQPALGTTLHTVVRCDLEAPAFTCTARAVMGPSSRTFYVSRDAAYVWVSGNAESWYLEDEQKESQDSYVYRLPLDGGEPTVLRARGNPIDQFSFRENEDGHLEVLLGGQGEGDSMWGPEVNRGSGEFALLRAPLSAFSADAPKAAGEHYTRLPGPTGYRLQNRFVGNHLLWSMDSFVVSEQPRIWVTDVRAPEAVKELELAHGVERIEALGAAGAVVVGTDGTNLYFTALKLGDTPEFRGQYMRPSATQGETRSHGFFFKPAEGGGGVLGLPARLNGSSWMHLRYGSAEVNFLRVSPELGLAPLGALVAREESRDDACVKSCVDWYGNARPIFYRNRIFALMGYELIEAQVGQEALQETFRASFLEAAR
ncbi:beta-propeller domain-containing protein [Hyalangium rubrum]|uniref:Beta-propeller domain-containing protein n=1 Tax=Hyalangium rubrum TaxID=3103134 RepID=A0ABU5H2B3_9BACT|nr:beta-propeller domain-containing protein [Hyalangium sp. s54d21]MDY7227615.1 beta-propeller domain-containing protein [Hyalangium sp. s54d21]